MPPLDEIADWQDIHGIDHDELNAYGSVYIYTRLGMFEVPNVFFTERNLVDVMKFRESYIKKLHSLIKERIPSGANIKIRILKNQTNHIQAATYTEGQRTLNEKVAVIIAGGYDAIKKAEHDSLMPSDIIINITYRDAFYTFNYNIANPQLSTDMVDRYKWSQYNPIVKADVPSIIYNTVKELSGDASARVMDYTKAIIYRPSGTLGPSDTGGPGYKRTMSTVGFSPRPRGNSLNAVEGGKRSRTKRRKTLRKKRYSKKN